MAMATTFPADAPRSAASTTFNASSTIPAIEQAIPRLRSGTSGEHSGSEQLAVRKPRFRANPDMS